MKPYLLEETREVMEGIDIFQKTGQWDNLCEELGDVLYNVLMQCEIANEMGIFTINDVIQGISEKMIRRHPKVFASEKGANDNSSIEQSWEEIKAQEKLMKSGKANERGKSQDNSRERQQMT
jgi:tetrapyrrole methylase family protein/MazG family protein